MSFSQSIIGKYLLLLGVIFVISLTPAFGQVFPKMTIDFSVNNHGDERFGFPDGYIPTLFRATQKVSNFQEFRNLVVTPSLNSDGVFRFTFEKPLSIKLADFKTGEAVSSRILRYINVRFDPVENDKIAELFAMPEGHVVFFGDFDKTVKEFNESMASQGVEGVATSSFRQDLPEFYKFHRLSFRLGLDNLNDLATPANISGLFGYKKILGPRGTYDERETSYQGVMFNKHMDFRDPVAQDLLNRTLKVRLEMKRKMDATLSEIMGVHKEEPMGKVIPFPFKPQCIDALINPDLAVLLKL